MTIPYVSLTTVAKFNPSTPKLAPEDEVAFVPMAAVSECGNMRTGQYKSATDLANGYSYFQSSDVLVAKRTPCYENNKITVANINRLHGFGSTEFHVIRPDLQRLDARYLAYYLRQDSVRQSGTRRMTGSGGQRRVPRNFIEELKIPLPSLDEQRRITGILDQTDALRRKRQEVSTQLEHLKRAQVVGICPIAPENCNAE
jgi:type I restriction enzyme, S subunit